MSKQQNPIAAYLSEFKVINKFSKDFWLTNFLYFFDTLAYFSMIHVLVVYLTQNCNFSDIDSGIWVGFYTLFVTAFVFAVGSICDIIGIKKALYIGIALHLVSRLGLAAGSEIHTTFLGLNMGEFTVKSSILLMALGSAFVTPVIQAAIRRFSNKETRGAGFNLYYLLMNVSAFTANFVLVTIMLENFGNIKGQEYIMYFGVITTVVALFAAFFVNEHNYADPNERSVTANTRRPLAIFAEVWKEKSFQKLVLFLFLSLGVRLVFTLQFLIFPKYYRRMLFDDFPIGLASAVNPFIIVFGLIAVIPILNKYSTVKLMVLGMSISAFSMVLLVFPVEWFFILPGVNTTSDAFLFVVFAQIVIFAFGELLFNPRFTEYVASMAPKDKVTSYMALSALPMYIAKPINGLLSGILVAYFCYEGMRAKIDTGNVTFEESPQSMWLIYLILAVLSPLSVLLFRNKLADSKPGAIDGHDEMLQEAREIEATYLDPQEKEVVEAEMPKA